MTFKVARVTVTLYHVITYHVMTSPFPSPSSYIPYVHTPLALPLCKYSFPYPHHYLSISLFIPLNLPIYMLLPLLPFFPLNVLTPSIPHFLTTSYCIIANNICTYIYIYIYIYWYTATWFYIIKLIFSWRVRVRGSGVRSAASLSHRSQFTCTSYTLCRGWLGISLQ